MLATSCFHIIPKIAGYIPSMKSCNRYTTHRHRKKMKRKEKKRSSQSILNSHNRYMSHYTVAYILYLKRRIFSSDCSHKAYDRNWIFEFRFIFQQCTSFDSYYILIYIHMQIFLSSEDPFVKFSIYHAISLYWVSKIYIKICICNMYTKKIHIH